MLEPTAGVQIHVGDVRKVLPTLEAESIDCVATSPPFFQQRDYGTDGQIGLELTPDEYVAELVAVFRECRRLLKPAGTLWIEIGDSYASYSGSGNRREARRDGMNGRFKVNQGALRDKAASAAEKRPPAGLKYKDLIGAPWLLAFALRADGWWLRQEIIWAKPDTMPESAKDRCTTAHSRVFLLSKQPRYHFDAAAIAEPAAWERWGDQTTPKHNGTVTGSGWVESKTKDEIAETVARDTRHPRSVWTITTAGFSGLHFAAMPEELAEKILLAGCPPGGTVLDPFGGAGTTALVARRLRRSSVLVELNPEYAALAAERCRAWWKPTQAPALVDPDDPQLSILG